MFHMIVLPTNCSLVPRAMGKIHEVIGEIVFEFLKH